MDWIGSLWAYLKVPDPYVAWEVYRGHLITAHSGEPPAGWSAISSVLASALAEGQQVRLQHELAMEQIRRSEFPEAISRLKAMYFFEDHEAALTAPDAWEGIPSYFAAEHLAELGFMQPPQTSRHDSIWIDREMWRETPFDEEDVAWIRSYWSGESAMKSPLWEILAEGQFWVWGTETRDLAHETIVTKQAKALGMLEVARVAAHLDSTLGHCTPLVAGQGDQRALRYFMDMRDATNPEFLERLRQYRGPKNTSEMNSTILSKEGLTVPNFLAKEFEFIVPSELADFL